MPAVRAKFRYQLRAVDEGAVRGSGGGGGGGSAAAAWRAAAASSTSPGAASLLGGGAYVHKPALFFALQHHLGVTLAPDALPAPAVLPGTAGIPVGVSADGVAQAVAAAAKGLPAPSGPGVAASGSEVGAAAYDIAPALAPLVWAPASAGSLSGSLLAAAGAASSAYDFSRPDPVAVGDLLRVRPVADGVRPPFPADGRLEASVLATTVEGALAAGDVEGALEAAHVRLAMLTCLYNATSLGAVAMGARGTAADVAGGATMVNALDAAADLVECLLAVGGCHLAAGRLGDAAAAADAALAHISGRHALAARALALRAQAAVLSGSTAAGLTAYAQAAEAAGWHLGRAHPLLASLAAGVGNALVAAGRAAAGGVLLEGAAEAAARALGSRHAGLGPLHADAGAAFRAAAAAGAALEAGYTGGAAAGDAGARAVTGCARAHHAAYLARASEHWERAALLLDAGGGGGVPGGSPAGSPASSPAAASTALVAAGGGGGGGSAGGVSCAAAADACAALADVQAAGGKVSQALVSAKRALEFRRLLPGAAEGSCAPYCQSLQQVAALADRLDRPMEAARCLEALVGVVKRARSEVAAVAVQRGTRHIIRLVLASLPANQRTLLQHLLTGRTGAPPAPALTFVIRSLFDALRPSEVVRALFARVLAGVGSGAIVADGTGAFVQVAGVPGGAAAGAADGGGGAAGHGGCRGCGCR